MQTVDKSVENLIGNTPLVRLRKIEQAFSLRARLYAKVESGNAGGSIKDRVAKTMIEDYNDPIFENVYDEKSNNLGAIYQMLTEDDSKNIIVKKCMDVIHPGFGLGGGIWVANQFIFSYSLDLNLFY